MVCCAIAGCSTHSRNLKKLSLKFYSFPKDNETRKKWVNACRRANSFSIDTAKICSLHFESSAYARDLKSELLNLPPKNRLIQGAVPTLNLLSSVVLKDKSSTSHNKRTFLAQNRSSKKDVEDILQETSIFVSVVPSIKNEGLSSEEQTPHNRNEMVFTIKQEPGVLSEEQTLDNSDEMVITIKQEPVDLSEGETSDNCLQWLPAKLKEEHDLSYVQEDNHHGNLAFLKEELDAVKTSILTNPRTPIKGKNRFSCDACCKQFSTNTYAKFHCTKRFSCDHCSKRFSHKDNLAKHMMMHFKDKRYSCNLCLKLFAQKRYIKGHMLIHSGEKPFSCNQCFKKFTQSGTLKRHMMTHSTEKSFSCDRCFKQFSRQGFLKRHMLTHSRESVSPVISASYSSTK